MPNCFFDFKRFRVEQSGAAMKVGTDGALLGAWARLEGTEERILDIGTGTGVIALMMAQRCPRATVDAVEIDPDAARQAQENVLGSPWPERIRIHNQSIQDFAQQTDVRYDRILCNPPFFVRSLKAPDALRSMARHADTLSFDELARAVERLLASDGRFSTVYPTEEASVFQEIAKTKGLYLNRLMRVRGTPRVAFKRIFMGFSRRETAIEEKELTIETAPQQFTEDYMRLTSDFYLKF